MVERRTAVHYELARLRRRDPGEPLYRPLAWEASSGTLLCDVRTPMPLFQTRAAVLATGLLPARRELDGHDWVGTRTADAFEGVNALTYEAIAMSLDIPLQRTRRSDAER